jgi:hypothetical protein
MASKRMFSAKIVDSDAFLDMPQTSQLLYFHLAMRVDDDGFVGNPKKIMRMIGSADNDLSVLLTKKFIIGFDSGIIVIKHHRMNNNWDKHNCKRTQYLEEFNQLNIKENGSYTLSELGLPVQTEYRLETDWKQSLEENRIDKNRRENTSLSYLKEIPQEDLEEFYNRFDCDKQKIMSKGEDLYNYCQSKGKKYKNYKALLLNALKKDIPERKEKPQSRKVVMIEGKPTLIN